MSPLAQSERHDAPWLIGEAVPGEAAMVEDVVVGFEDAVRQPVVAHELPDVLDRVELGAFRRQRQQGDVGGDDQPCREMPARLIEDQHGMGPGATEADISARCRVMPSVLQRGRTSAAPLPSAGQMAP